jgi:hypothetical protein
MTKLAYPRWPWTACLGAPSVSRRGLAGGAGGKAPVQPDDTFTVLGTAVGLAVPGLAEVPDTLGALAELVVAALADEVVFESRAAYEGFCERVGLTAPGLGETLVDGPQRAVFPT